MFGEEFDEVEELLALNDSDEEPSRKEPIVVEIPSKEPTVVEISSKELSAAASPLETPTRKEPMDEKPWVSLVAKKKGSSNSNPYRIANSRGTLGVPRRQ